MPDTPKPPVSAPSPEQREVVIVQLSRAFAAGLIELEDLEARTEIAVRSRTADELISALDGIRPQTEQVATERNPQEFAVDHPRRHLSRATVAIMSGTDRKGMWAPARRHITVALMGGAFLDFRDAALGPGVTDVYCWTIWGGIEVAVPEGLDVEVSGAAIMGALERVSQESGSTDPRRPQLHIHAVALMGGIVVRVKPPGEKFEDNDEDEEA